MPCFMNLLIVEDEVQLADALAEILYRNKYHVDTVYNGEDGLHYASTGIYDCIVLDIMLPILQFSGCSGNRKFLPLFCS